MRHLAARPKQPSHTKTTQRSGYDKHLARVARSLGGLRAAYWPDARMTLPLGSTIGDYRIKCEADFNADDDAYLVDAFLDGFNEEVARRAMLGIPGFENAREVLLAEARMYELRAERANRAAQVASS